MKFSTTTALAILASSVAVQAAPIDAAQAAHAQFASSTDLTFVKKSDAAQIKSLIAEISHINKKREFTDDPVELAELQRRADSAIGNLLSAFLNSGIISDVFNTLTTDSGIRSSLGSILSTVGSALVENAKPLLSAVWNSGIIGKVFNDIINDKDLINAFLAAIPDVLLAVTSLLGFFTGGSSSSAAPSSGASKREIVDMSNLSEDEYLSKRDLSSIIAWVVQEIKDSGIVQNLVNNFLQDPSKYLSIIGNVLLSALNIGEEIFNWAKSSGLLESGLNWLENNGGSFLGSLAKIISSLLGSSSSSSSTPSTASAAAAAAPSPAAQGYANTVTTHTTTTAAVTAGAGPTTTAASGSNSGGVNAVFQAAQAAGKARRNY